MLQKPQHGSNRKSVGISRSGGIAASILQRPSGVAALGPEKTLRGSNGDTCTISTDTRPFFAEIVNSSHDPIISTDLTGTIIVWNRAAVRVFGYPVGKIVGQSIMQLIPPDSRRQEIEILRSLGADHFIAPYKASWIRRGGGKADLLVTVFPVRNGAGRPIGASRIAGDLAERQKLDEDRYQLAAIVDSADDAIVSKDLNGIVLSWNRGDNADVRLCG
jgi:PAS domain S-box-containing protein